MNCPNCGRPLAEGEICNCINVNEAPFTPPVEAEQAPQEAAAPVEQQTYYQPPQADPYAQPQGAPYAPFNQQPNENYYQPPIYGPEQPVMPVYVPARTDYPEGYKIKKKYVAVILAAVFGPLGLHNFYLGNKNKGLAQLLICLIGSLFVGLGYIAAYIWAIVDCIQLLTEKQDKDAEGFKIQTLEEAIVAEKIRAEKKIAEENELKEL